jgi:hypothetical protein
MRTNATRLCVSRALELEKRLPPDRRALVQPARDANDPVVACQPMVRSTFWFPRHPTSGLFGYTLQAAAQHACAPDVRRGRPAERGTLRRLVAMHELGSLRLLQHITLVQLLILEHTDSF